MNCKKGSCSAFIISSTYYERTCAFGCNATRTGCNESSYCVDHTCTCPSGCEGKNTLDWCWPSYSAYQASGRLNPTYTACVNTTACAASCANTQCIATPPPNPLPTECLQADQCTAVSYSCSVDTIVPPCRVRYPGDPNRAVERHDNCYDPITGYGIACGAACGVPVGTPCVPDCSGTGNVCSGIWYNDPTGCGGCLGTKYCVGTLTARSFSITSANTSCAAIAAATDSLPGTVFSFSPVVNPPSQTQVDTRVVWTNVTTDGTTNYALSSLPAGQYALGNVCVSQNGGGLTQAAAGTLTDGGTLSFRVGYIPQIGWFQTAVGNVYAATQLTSSIPSTATNPYLSLVGAGGTAGVVSFGTGYDFSLSAGDLGETQVSPAGWLVQQINLPINYYERFAQKLANEPKTALTTNLNSLTKPTSCTTPPCIYTVEGAMQTASGAPWTIGANEQMIILVNNGDVTINSPITITSGGFFALIVNGSIIISPGVGGLTTSAAPHIEGIYIATREDHVSGVFVSGNSSTVGRERLNVVGSVIADTFSLQRDLGVANDTTPAESFTFNPQLLFTMPDVMKEAPYVWQEVAP